MTAQSHLASNFLKYTGKIFNIITHLRTIILVIIKEKLPALGDWNCGNSFLTQTATDDLNNK